MHALIDATVSVYDEDYEMVIREHIKQTATTILCSTFSPDNNYLVCGTKDGKILVWEMADRKDSLLSSSSSLSISSASRADKVFIAHRGPVYSLLFLPGGNGDSSNGGSGVLVSGGDDGLSIWEWQHIVQGENTPIDIQPISRVNSGSSGDSSSGKSSNSKQPEINALLSFSDNKIIAGSGDGNIYFLDLTTTTTSTSHNSNNHPQVIHTLAGHKDGVYCLTKINENTICSGGEDGLVHLWDIRTNAIVKSLEHCTGKVGTPEAPLGPPGKHTPYISCMSSDPSSDLLVCGGGARILSLWSLSAEKVLATMPTAGNPQAVMFYKEGVVSAGNDRYVYQWEKDGKMITRIKTSAPSVFTLSLASMDKTPCIASAGTGQFVDLISEPFAVKSSLSCF